MIRDTHSMRLPTIDGTDIRVLTNWNDKVNGEYLKIVMDGKTAIIPRASFTSAALLLGNEEEQMKLIPTKTTRIRRFTKTVTVALQRDMAAGSELTIPVSFEVPLDGASKDELSFIQNNLR